VITNINSASVPTVQRAIWVPDVSYPNLFVTRRFAPGYLKMVRVRYVELGLGLVLVLRLGVSVRVTDYG